MTSDLPPGWSLRRLDEVADIVGGGTPSTKVDSNFGDDVPWITPKDLSSHSGRYIARGGRSLSRQGFQNSSAQMLPTGTVLVSSRAPIGYVAIAANPLSTNQGFRSLILRDGHVPEFFYYLIKGNVELLKSHASGTTFKEISGTSLGAIELPIPPKKEQLRIAEVLGVLDRRSEINRDADDTLEDLSDCLFLEWCLPAEMVRDRAGNPTTEGLPDGWTLTSLNEIGTFLNGAACQKYGAKAGEPSLPVIKIRELRQGITESSDRASLDVPPKYKVRDGDLLFSWSGSLLVQVWTGGTGFLNQHLFKVSSDRYPRWFLYQWIKYHLARFQRIAADKATTMGHIKRSHLSEAKVALPPAEELDEMTRLFRPLLELRVVNGLQVGTLTDLRDLLLPRLLDGHVATGETPIKLEVVLR